MARFLYSHTGRQFFFVTFTVAGRRPVLSRLVEGEARPQLTRLGWLVEAALHALHLVKAAVGVADFVIMPDHVHFLLIVNYDLDREISPVYLTKRLMEAVEAAAAGEPNGPGALPPDPRAARAEMRVLTAKMAGYLREAMRRCDLAYFHGEDAASVGQMPFVGQAQALVGSGALGGRGMMAFPRLHARLGDLWWYSILLFVVQRFGDVINMFVGLWLVPKYVPQNRLGAVPPLM